jgi:hypothetical protein
MGSKAIAVRIPIDLFKRIQEISKLRKVDTSELVKRAFVLGMERLMLETAIELYYEGKLKQSEAARMANMTVKDFMAVAKERRCC